jgi:hypothetical protein
MVRQGDRQILKNNINTIGSLNLEPMIPLVYVNSFLKIKWCNQYIIRDVAGSKDLMAVVTKDNFHFVDLYRHD